ncbi:hypothetical protein PABG_07463 [Paracoccidioides brasiliensis Pb03]|nr:hypothetical protein PABG_07463 [Paracoccidioides brasiliensis Pb03]
MNTDVIATTCKPSYSALCAIISSREGPASAGPHRRYQRKKSREPHHQEHRTLHYHQVKGDSRNLLQLALLVEKVDVAAVIVTPAEWILHGRSSNNDKRHMVGPCHHEGLVSTSMNRVPYCLDGP